MQKITYEDFFNFIAKVQSGKLSPEAVKKLKESMLMPWTRDYKNLEFARTKTLDDDPYLKASDAISAGESIALGMLYEREQRKHFLTREGLEAAAMSYNKAVSKHPVNLHDHFRAEDFSGYVDIFEENAGFDAISAAGFPRVSEKQAEAFNRGYVSVCMVYRKTFMHGMHPIIRNADDTNSLKDLLLKNLMLRDSEQRTLIDITMESDGWRVHLAFMGPKEIIHTDYSYSLIGEGHVKSAAADARLFAASLSKYFDLGYTPEVNVPKIKAKEKTVPFW